MNDIYTFQKKLSLKLLLWSFSSIAAGIFLARRQQTPDRRGFGQQALVWGMIDAAIALFGLGMARRRAADPSAQTEEAKGKETGNLRRLLWINSGLDLLYVAGGWLLARRADPQGRGWRGHGWGIVVQGAFLLLFDLYHALQLGEETGMRGVDEGVAGDDRNE
jgi:hypothetical protein